MANMVGNHHPSNILIASFLPPVPGVQFIMNNKHDNRQKYIDMIMKQCEMNLTTGGLEWRGSKNCIYSQQKMIYSPTVKKITSVHRLLCAVATDSFYLLQNPYSSIVACHLCHNLLCCSPEH